MSFLHSIQFTKDAQYGSILILILKFIVTKLCRKLGSRHWSILNFDINDRADGSKTSLKCHVTFCRLFLLFPLLQNLCIIAHFLLLLLGTFPYLQNYRNPLIQYLALISKSHESLPFAALHVMVKAQVTKTCQNLFPDEFKA